LWGKQIYGRLVPPKSDEGGSDGRRWPQASEVKPGSSVRVWWQCKINPTHEWLATITVRTQKKSRGLCPHCSGQIASSANSIQEKHPDVAKEPMRIDGQTTWIPFNDGKKEAAPTQWGEHPMAKHRPMA
jgi:hypothetical protein